jgi:pimeloyl-ACP methyl ester carboxylesterase
MHFLTTENGKFHGPASSHLTVYIEAWNGKLRLAAQDIQNMEEPHGLTQGPLKGGYNAQVYDSSDMLFGDDQWHCVEALFQLNTLDVKRDMPNADGIVRGWFDDKLVVDRPHVVLRSTDFPRMQFNQFLLLPYFGPGLLPHAQTLWIDELAVGTQRPVSTGRLRLPGQTFELDGHAAFLMTPKVERQTLRKPWIFYAPTLPPYPDEHETWMHEKFLDAGVAVAGVDVGESYGSPAGRKVFDAFYKELVERRGYAPRPCLLARSRGGLWMASWAADHPDRVAGLAGIYPAFDLRTYPGLAKAAPAYGLDAEALAQSLKTHNPIERVAALAQARLPALLIHGDQDDKVPLAPNSARFAAIYEDAGAANAVKVILCAGHGHNLWTGYSQNQELVDFVIDRAWAGAADLDRK